MCSSMPLVLPHDDKELILFLGERRVGDPIPPNVITEVNPFSIEPWDFPGEMWFSYNSDEPHSCSKESIIQVTRNGYWKSMDDLRIFASTSIVGRKTTRQFYIGQAPFGDRTGWMMHDYKAEKMVVHGMSKAQDTNSLCRMFLHFNGEQRYPRVPEQCNPLSPEQCRRPGGSEQCDPWSPEHCGLVSQQLSDPMGLESTLLRLLEEEEEERNSSRNLVSQQLSDPMGLESTLLRLLEEGEERNSSRNLVSQQLSDPMGLESTLLRFLEEGEERNSSRNAASNSQIVSEVGKRRPESSVGPSQDLVVNGNSMEDMQAICDFSKGDAEALLRDIENESRLNLELKDLYDPVSSPTSADDSSLMLIDYDDYVDVEALLRDIENESRLNLELKDLYDPVSSPTSADDSSPMSMDSDDYFDAEALLRDIENDSRLNLEEGRVDYMFNISSSVRSPPSVTTFRDCHLKFSF